MAADHPNSKIESKINKSKIDSKIIVQKYGGSTLASPQKIREVAHRIAELSKSGTKVVAAVSAMGKTTNQLIELAHHVSSRPSRRELDMLLTTGERISMALVSMALQDLGCEAISFTGSQAGILTDESHVNAQIVDVKAFRVEEALANGKVVVLAGFQGVSPITKEITTLGRGGTDTTAVAMAAYLEADRCEILKDVAGVFSADPHLIPHAIPLRELSYEQMIEMTFWGAKVLHHRSVEMAQQKNVVLYIGPASNNLDDGTIIKSANPSLVYSDGQKFLGLNSHERVFEISMTHKSSTEAISRLKSDLEKLDIASPQVLFSHQLENEVRLYITGPTENLRAILNEKSSLKNVRFIDENLCSVTATCANTPDSYFVDELRQKLSQNQNEPKVVHVSSLSVNLILAEPQRKAALLSLHEFIKPI